MRCCGGVGGEIKLIYDTGYLLGIGPFPLAGDIAGAGGRRGHPEHEADGGSNAVSDIMRVGECIPRGHGSDLHL